MSLLPLMMRNKRDIGPPPPPDPPSGPPGTPYGGGFYAGNIIVDGQEYYLVVADAVTQTGRAWKTSSTSDNFPFTLNDGWKNTNFINDVNHPAAQLARAYTGGGFNDWYLPSRDEAEICYRVFKPNTVLNTTSARGADVGGGLQGANANSNPVHPAYTASSPAQTSVADFKTGQAQAFVISPGYWTSTQGIGSGFLGSAALQDFYDGNQFSADKTNPTGQVRPVRRIPKIAPTEPNPVNAVASNDGA